LEFLIYNIWIFNESKENYNNTHSLNLKFESKELTVKIKGIGKINNLNIKNPKFQISNKSQIRNSKSQI